MKNTGIIFALLLNWSVFAQIEIADTFAKGLVAKEIIGEIDERLTMRISQAAGAGEFLLEKNYRQLRLLLQNADIVLKDSINLTFDRLEEKEKTFLQTINSLIQKTDELKGSLLKLEAFAAMDLSTLLGLLPGINGDEFLIRNVEGTSQSFKSSGSYNIVFTGQAFTQENRVSVMFNGQPIKLRPFSETYRMEAEIPVALLNSEFDDSSVKRININVKSWKQKKRFLRKKKEYLVLDYTTEILLLPKYPISYEFVEVVRGNGWSEEIQTISGASIAHATGVSGRWIGYAVSVTIPDNGLMIQPRTRSWIASGIGAGTWGYWDGGFNYTNNNEFGPRTVSRKFQHQIHDQNRTLAIEASYRTPVDTFGRSPIVLKDPIDSNEFNSQIQFGKLYEGLLNSDYVTYYIRLKYFNGKEVILQEGSAYEGINLRTINNRGFNAVTLKVKKPY